MHLLPVLPPELLLVQEPVLLVQAPVLELFDHPAHPYTKALLRSVPGIMDRRDRVLESIEGMVPEQYDMITGCRFADRCPYRRDICGWRA